MVEGEAAASGHDTENPTKKEDEVAAEDEPAEADAPDDARPRLAAATRIRFAPESATANALQSGRLVTAVGDGALQFLHAAARANVGVKAGRYMFEVRVLETLCPDDGGSSRWGRQAAPRQVVRLGVTQAGASPILREDSGAFYFDWEGYVVYGASSSRLPQRSLGYGRDHVFAVMINADKGCVSLFRDGECVSKAQSLPPELVGKPLYPTVTYKNVTLDVHFGPNPGKPLPFKCRMLQDASEADVEVAKSAAPAKPEVLFPVGLPDQGVFEWLDQFLEANPGHLELSDRMIAEWAERSGAYRQRGYHAASNDNPGLEFGIPMLADGSVQETLAAIVPALGRDIVLMRLKDNLIAEQRRANLQRFPAGAFRRVAVVAVGEPNAEYKEKVQQKMLKAKIEKLEWEKQGNSRKGYAPWRSRKDSTDAKEEAETKEEDGADTKEEDAEKKEEDQAEEKTEKAVELTEEERSAWHLKLDTPDLEKSVLQSSFAEFTLPVTDEGFDEIRYVWDDAESCVPRVKAWVLDLKRTQRIDKLEPSKWFRECLETWNKQVQTWKDKQYDTKNSGKEPVRLKSKQEVANEDQEGEKKKDENADGESKEEAAKQGDEAGKADEAMKPAEVDEEEIDVFEVEDIDDIGNGRPLYANWEYEDWKLLSLRYEFHLLVHAFCHDLDDPERPSFHEKHFNFYYEKYYDKALNVELYCCKTLGDLVDLIKDSVAINAATSFVEAPLSVEEPLHKFVRRTEEHRRDRQRCIDAGDETARIKFRRASAPPPPLPKGQRDGGQRHYSGRDSYNRGGSAYTSSGGYNSRSGGGGSRYPTARGEKRPYESASSSNYANKSSRYSAYGGSSSHYDGGRSSYHGGGYGGRR